MSYRYAFAGIAFLLTLAAWSHPALADREEYTQVTEHTFQIQGDGRISAATPDGNVTVNAWDGDDVSLIVTKRIRTRKSASSAEAFFDKMRVDIENTAGTLDIKGDVPDYRMGVGYGFSIDYELHVPTGVSVELRTSDGVVHVAGVSGKVYAKSSDGDIAVNDVGLAELRTSDGNIRVEAVEGDVSAITSDGDIQVSNIGGDVNIRSSDGNVDCREVSGLVVLQLSDGDARLQGIHGGLTARSSDGELVVRDAAGPIELKTSDGNIELSLAEPIPMSRVVCTSSDGDIRLDLPESAAFTVEARTSSGRVNIGVPGKFQFDPNGKRVEGHANGGGPAVMLRTSDGSIMVEPA